MPPALQNFLNVLTAGLKAPLTSQVVSEPYHETGVWVADLTTSTGKVIVVQYSEQTQFGVGLVGHDPGLTHQADASFPDCESAVKHTLELE